MVVIAVWCDMRCVVCLPVFIDAFDVICVVLCVVCLLCCLICVSRYVLLFVCIYSIDVLAVVLRV